MAYVVKSCPLCGVKTNNSETPERSITLQCRSCGAIVDVEFDPPDNPAIRGRITVVHPPCKQPNAIRGNTWWRR